MLCLTLAGCSCLLILVSVGLTLPPCFNSLYLSDEITDSSFGYVFTKLNTSDI